MAVNLKGRSFLTLMDFTPEEIRYMLDLAHDLKAKKRSGIQGEMLKGKNIVLLFDKTSTRTRCSFEVACHDEGAHVTYLDSKEFASGQEGEHRGFCKGPGADFLTVSSIAATSRRWSRILRSTPAYRYGTV